MKNIYQFYSTPKGLALKMRDIYPNPENILDPSAGKGALLEFFPRDTPKYAIEINPEFQYQLQSEYEFIGIDFLEYSKDRYFDLIIMNPPFQNGTDHLLKAWEVTDHYVVCLLNAETIKNPYSQKRQHLIQLIKSYGGYEFIGKPFKDIDVEVALVWLEKKGEKLFDIPEYEKIEDFDLEKAFLPEKIDGLQRLIDRNTGALESLKSITRELVKLKALYPSEYGFDNILNDLKSLKASGYNSAVKEINRAFWGEVLDTALFKNNVSKDVLNDLQKYISKASDMAFTKGNIFSILDIIILNWKELKLRTVKNVFRDLTRYYDENREYLEGWKSNSSYQLKKRIVYPYIMEVTYSGSLQIGWDSIHKINDIDKACCTVTGKKFENIIPIAGAIQTAIDEGKSVAYSKFFKIRFYKKGTVHLYFLSEGVRALFNKAVLDNKLPENVGK